MPRERVMVSTRPDFDAATTYASYWVGKTLRVLEELGMRATDLFSSLAVKDKLVEAFENHDPLTYWGVGHGNEMQFAGQDALIMLQKGVDEPLFVERIIHLTSCLTGAAGGLLESIANAGALVAIGYSIEVIVGIETENFPVGDPTNDATRSLLAPDCHIEFVLAQGKSTAQAILESDDKSNAEIEYWRASGHPDSDLLIWSHINNRDGKVVYGLPQAESRVVAEPVSTFAVLAGLTTMFSAGMAAVKW